ncbi:50S ribosomal protein L28 [Williamsoniiplasma somnilux]|uniref:Large ribosomal subunit protein bL28 n=1 Tax=Williamsoniiplasma somnilux TaxID=215578 RepID=A0A2K8NXY6_9MOLU|nr:50S ribosomal protein L28 [Williamsoniiplasma somnilux]ATZ18604.1 50S ribosomal protein L28 [Williamsoniiplasma somnilux]
MARKDTLTGKGALSGNSRSHALNATRRKWNLNLQKIKVMDENGRTFTIKVSARTLRTLKKQDKVVG